MALILYYLLGAFPSGFLISRLKGVDITAQGSGNVGATNVARILGRKAGLVTFVLDTVKGAVAPLSALYLISDVYAAFAAAAVVSGHCFSIPPFLKGGKGVATAFGTMLVLVPYLALISVLIFLAVFYFSRTVSLSSLSALIIAPVILSLGVVPDRLPATYAYIALVATLKHRSNLKRLIEGSEPKFKQR